MEKKKIKKPILTDEDMGPENISANITIRMSAELLNIYKEWAKELGVGYQTLMKIKLTEALKGKDLEERVLVLESKLKKQA
jgi:predicted DNA binding CopG/RHH family protein